MTSEFPVVESQGLRLRRWTEDDAPAVLSLALDRETKRWSQSLYPVNDLDGALAFIQSRQGTQSLDWAACDALTGEVLARVGLHHFDGQVSAEIGYGVLPGHRGKGIALRAARAAVEYGFGVRGLARIGLLHAVANTTSCAVASRLGFAYEGTQRSVFDHGDGILHDAHVHGRTREDPDLPLPLPPQPIEPVELETASWRLLPWSEADLDDVLAAFTEPHIVAWDAALPLAGDAAAIRWLVGRRRGWVLGTMAGWGVHDTSTGELVGSVTLREIASGQALVAYWVRAAHLGRGIAPAAVAAACDFGFTTLRLHRVGLYHAVDNVASCRVAEKCGFRLEGTTRASDRLSSGWVDEHLHARLATD